MTYYRATLLGDLLPWGACTTAEAYHGDCSDCHEYAQIYTGFRGELVPMLGTQGEEKTQDSGSGGESREEVEQVARI